MTLLPSDQHVRMFLVVMKNYCPSCGYPELGAPAYQRIGSPPWFHPGPPPYEQWYGNPSYEVCACCGFEFGNDDNPGTALPYTFEEFRREWIAAGHQWFDESKRPAAWCAEEQFEAVGIVALS
jgi:ribosomal protein L37E